MLVNAQVTREKLTSVNVETKKNADQFTTWMKHTNKNLKNSIRNEYTTIQEEFNKKFNGLISDLKSKHESFNAAYSTDTAKLYARTHAKAESDKWYDKVEKYQMNMANNFQQSWTQFIDSADTEMKNLQELSKHTETIIFDAIENFFQESDIKK